MKRLLIHIYCILSTCLIFGQVEEIKDSVPEEDPQYIIIEGDSIPRAAIDLQEVIIFDRLKFNSRDAKIRYYILKRKTIKVYPYAKLAAERLTILNERLANIRSKRQRKKYTKLVQKYIEEEFTEELKKFTRTEGQILVKLIHRQTGETAFDLIKELRSGWRAFWYNTTASMFDISLKREYHPESIQEDYLIEDILQRAFAKGKLEKQPSALDFDYIELTNKWTTANVENK